jgi:hypothetical protein
MMTKFESAETQQNDTGKLIAVVNGRGYKAAVSDSAQK